MSKTNACVKLGSSSLISIPMALADLRRSYDKSSLLESSLASHPMQQLDLWLQQAMNENILDANAMTLATASLQGQPSARIVLLKHYDNNGLVFFTNYESRKGQELASNPQACALFYWPGMERQVRIEGQIEKIPNSESDAYFHSRPLGSRLAAWASPQSQEISLAELEKRMQTTAQSLGKEPERPGFWGGYRLLPHYVEFWQGRANRLNDRLAYTRQKHTGQWQITRLAP